MVLTEFINLLEEIYMKINDQAPKQVEHTLTLNHRKEIKMNGCIEVISATPTEILAKTDCGNVSITGNNLKVKNLLINEKSLEAEGEIFKIEYAKAKKSFFQKIFK